MKERNHARNDARDARRQASHGPEAQCLYGPPPHLPAPSRATRGRLEDHHVVGKAHDRYLTAPASRPCHDAVHERMRKAGVSLRPQATLLETEVMRHRALSAHFAALSDAESRWADEMQGEVERTSRTERTCRTRGARKK
jgi:hypothetical protein